MQTWLIVTLIFNQDGCQCKLFLSNLTWDWIFCNFDTKLNTSMKKVFCFVFYCCFLESWNYLACNIAFCNVKLESIHRKVRLSNDNAETSKMLIKEETLSAGLCRDFWRGMCYKFKRNKQNWGHPHAPMCEMTLKS